MRVENTGVKAAGLMIITCHLFSLMSGSVRRSLISCWSREAEFNTTNQGERLIIPLYCLKTTASLI